MNKKKYWLTLVNIGFPCKVATTHWSQSMVMLVLWKDSLGCRSSYRKSVTPPSNMLRKYLGISVRPIPANFFFIMRCCNTGIHTYISKYYYYFRSNICVRIFILLYRLGPSSRQNVRVRLASSSKNSVAKASHHRLSLSSVLCCNLLFISWIR